MLGEIADELDRAVATGSHADVERWLARFSEALRSHFELEEMLVFPALPGVIPASRPDLERLEREHGEFLARLGELLRKGAPTGEGLTLIDALAALRERLREHERVEEELIASGLALAELDGDSDSNPAT